MSWGLWSVSGNCVSCDFMAAYLRRVYATSGVKSPQIATIKEMERLVAKLEPKEQDE